jgi:AraC family transcriptional regulator, transcriptional activator of pobA
MSPLRRVSRVPPDIHRLGIYGTAPAQAPPMDLHIEELQARARALDYSIKPHVHPDMLQLFVSLSGKCVATIDGDVQRLCAPCVVSIPGGIAHCFEFGPGVKGWILTVAHQRIIRAPLNRNEDNVASLLRQPHILQAAGGDPHIESLAALMHLLHEEFRAERTGRQAGLEYLLRLVLLQHWREVERARPRASHADRDRQLFYDFRALVEQHYAQQWSIVDYARALRCSQPRLNRVCRLFGDSAANSIILVRLCEEAKRLLIFTTAPATSIGYRLGFQEPAYFTRFFRRQTRQTPGEFRARHAHATHLSGA